MQDLLSVFDVQIGQGERLEIIVRLGAALAAGAAIGFERSFHGRPAGLRTHSLVCLAFATKNIAGLVRRYEVDTLTQLSDHQPVFVEWESI